MWSALGAVYVIWGSTYLAIRVAVRTLPPLLMASARYLIAGAILYAWAIGRGDREGDRPGIREWRGAAIVGGLLLLGGNGGVVVAERRIPSSLAALLIATVPLWMVVIGRVILRERVSWLEGLGMALGLAGLILLVGLPGGGVDTVGAGIVLVAALCWAAGSMYSKRARLPARPSVATAMEMLAGGALLGLVGVAGGEIGDVHPAKVSLGSAVALVYLIVFGSLVAYNAYVWLLRVARTSLVSTYAFVNPVVAVVLGWAILSERITVRTVLAGGVIVVAVALIITARARSIPKEGSEQVPEDCTPTPTDAPAAPVRAPNRPG
jgi:drug/metabolite transporter (DMT)-like permease